MVTFHKVIVPSWVLHPSVATVNTVGWASPSGELLKTNLYSQNELLNWFISGFINPSTNHPDSPGNLKLLDQWHVDCSFDLWSLRPFNSKFNHWFFSFGWNSLPHVGENISSGSADFSFGTYRTGDDIFYLLIPKVRIWVFSTHI